MDLLDNWALQAQVLATTAYAMLLGGAVGFERELKNRPAGFRTHMLVAGACAMLVGLVDLIAQRYADGAYRDLLRVDPVRLIEAAVAAVGFLGAGNLPQSRGRPRFREHHRRIAVDGGGHRHRRGRACAPARGRRDGADAAGAAAPGLDRTPLETARINGVAGYAAPRLNRSCRLHEPGREKGLPKSRMCVYSSRPSNGRDGVRGEPSGSLTRC